MNKKLTLWLDEALIEHAKQHAEKTGTSVSRMFANFVTALERLEARKQLDPENTLDVEALLPTTRALLGILKPDGEDEEAILTR
ncbi:MAG: hypothetical protein JWM30_641 [Burkholderia sp.]|nr:hypothetical protein [Burkholderia sp.]